MKYSIQLRVNGSVFPVDVDPRERLLDTLRYKLDLTGTKEGCGTGDCGCCTVLMDGKPVTSCLVLALQSRGPRTRPSKVWRAAASFRRSSRRSSITPPCSAASASPASL